MKQIEEERKPVTFTCHHAVKCPITTEQNRGALYTLEVQLQTNQPVLSYGDMAIERSRGTLGWIYRHPI